MQPLPSRYMQTYGIRQHKWRAARCEEVNCPKHELGWSITVDLATELGQAQAQYLKYESGRRYTVERLSNTLAKLVFEPGQQCFTEHKLPEGDPRYVRERLGRAEGMRTEDWLEDFATNQERLKTLIERG